MLLVSVIWGVAGPIIKYTLASFSPLIFLVYRFAISTMIAGGYYLIAKPHIPKSFRDQSSIVIYSLCSVTFGLGLLFLGFDKTTSISGSVISATGPLAIILAGAWFLKERVTHKEKIGITIALLGTLIIVLYPFFNGVNNHDGQAIEGNLLILASLVLDTIAAILIKIMVRRRVDPQFLAHISFVIGFICLAPLAFYYHGLSDIYNTIVNAPLGAHLGVWFMAVFSGTIAYSLRNIAVKTIEVSETAVFSYLYPLWAAPLSLLWLGESITLPFLIGGGIIAAGVMVAEYKGKRV